ncbi:ABC transporter substrate-binding protein [Paenibacillus alvei]|uniref:ABC transporter substrate-binding protein n=1 Tax=Paenibacillus alvei TaxID=44250 RepID=UPI002284401C|nr:extracellular solute-binding protein [Paenibacillus alvei]
MLINSDGWKEAIKLVTNAVRDKFIYLQASNQNSEEMAEAFYRGQATMTINGPWLAKELKARALFDSASKSFEWDIATMPVDPSSPDESANVHVSEIYAVSEDSPNKQAAWEFVKFVNSADMVSAASRTPMENCPHALVCSKILKAKARNLSICLRPKQRLLLRNL